MGAQDLLLFYILMFGVAFLYATAGHGGASGYLALMALFNFQQNEMRPTALLLNVFVSLIAFVNYYKVVDMPWKLFLSLSIFSIPAAMLGGSVSLTNMSYHFLLGLVLLLAALRLAGLNMSPMAGKIDINWFFAGFLGLCIGFISGLTGIGGGILLSPLLLFLKWTDLKQTAAISAIFITCNSISGLIGQGLSGIHANDIKYALVLIVIAGGFAGAYFGANKFNPIWLKRSLALVIAIASIKLIFLP